MAATSKLLLPFVTMCKSIGAGLTETKVQSVQKHIPGHNERALVDIHLDRPIIHNNLETLAQSDFAVFIQ